MPHCAWCGQQVANVSAAPCHHCGKPMNGGQFVAPPAGGGSRTAIIIVVVIAAVLIGVAVLGIIAAIAIPNLVTAAERSKQKQTMRDIQTIAIALEVRATHTNDYPDVQNVSDLRPLLEPDYVHSSLTLVDGWGRPFRYACTSYEGGHCDSYALASSGKDGIFENDDLKVAVQSPPRPTTNFDCDIIYTPGKFVEYPEGLGGK